MHFIKQALLIMVLSFLVQLWLPWWSMVFPCVAISFLAGRKAAASFFAGFLAIGILWLGLSLYIDLATASTLSQKVAGLFPGQSVSVLRSIMVLVGGLVGGFASLSGFSIKALR